MRIPGPGTFIPDTPAAGGGILFFLLIAAIVSDSFGRSGAGEPGTVNYLTRQSVCAPAVDKFAEVQMRAREAYDSGAPDTTEGWRRVVESTGSILLLAGAQVSVLRRGDSAYSVVSASNGREATECWLATSSLKMGWGEWVLWNWREYRKTATAKRVLSNTAEQVRRRVSNVQTKIVACSTGPLLIKYTGIEVMEAVPVDFSRCLPRRGRVSVNGPPNGIVYFHDGRWSKDVDLRESAMLFAGPVGTEVRLECFCKSSTAAASDLLPRPQAKSPDSPTPHPDGISVSRQDPSVCSEVDTAHLVARSDQGGQDTFVGDAYHEQGAPQGETLFFGGWGDHYYDYLKFELPNDASSAGVSQSILCLYATAMPPNDPQLEVAVIEEMWSPATLTFNSQPPHRTRGLFGRVVDGWNAVDVSDIVSAWVSGKSPNNGIALIPRANNQTNGSFAASESPDENKRPKLILILNALEDSTR